jgi:hypothetical protein
MRKTGLVPLKASENESAIWIDVGHQCSADTSNLAPISVKNNPSMQTK